MSNDLSVEKSMKPLERFKVYNEKIKKANHDLFLENINELIKDIPDLYEYIKELSSEDYILIEDEDGDNPDAIKLRIANEKDREWYFKSLPENFIEEYKVLLIIDSYYKHSAYMCGVNAKGDFVFGNRSFPAKGYSDFLQIKNNQIIEDNFNEYVYISWIISTILESFFEYDC